MARKSGKSKPNSIGKRKPGVAGTVTLPIRHVFPKGHRALACKDSIKKTKGICGGKARVAGTRIPVWGLENARRLGLSVAEILERYPAISERELLAAWEYAAVNAEEIGKQIRENQEW